MEQELNQNTSIYIDAETKANFLVISKWIKFLSIMGFVGMGIMLIVGVGMIIAGLSFSVSMPGSVLGLSAIGFVYVIVSGVYLVPIYYFFKSAVDMRKGLMQNNQIDFSSGVTYLKSHFKFVGVLAIIILSIYVCLFVGAAVMAVSRF